MRRDPGPGPHPAPQPPLPRNPTSLATPTALPSHLWSDRISNPSRCAGTPGDYEPTAMSSRKVRVMRGPWR